MSMASSFVASFKRTEDKKLIRLHIKYRATRVHATTDGLITYFADDSAVIDRKIVNTIQLFRS